MTLNFLNRHADRPAPVRCACGAAMQKGRRPATQEKIWLCIACGRIDARVDVAAEARR